jgi:hypothetical protein
MKPTLWLMLLKSGRFHVTFAVSNCCRAMTPIPVGVSHDKPEVVALRVIKVTAVKE